MKIKRETDRAASYRKLLTATFLAAGKEKYLGTSTFESYMWRFADMSDQDQAKVIKATAMIGINAALARAGDNSRKQSRSKKTKEAN